MQLLLRKHDYKNPLSNSSHWTVTLQLTLSEPTENMERLRLHPSSGCAAPCSALGIAGASKKASGGSLHVPVLRVAEGAVREVAECHRTPEAGPQGAGEAAPEAPLRVRAWTSRGVRRNTQDTLADLLATPRSGPAHLTLLLLSSSEGVHLSWGVQEPEADSTGPLLEDKPLQDVPLEEMPLGVLVKGEAPLAGYDAASLTAPVMVLLLPWHQSLQGEAEA
ncbi:hypothetical protein E2C01_016785 [Portunus trituberculatus]|uniref:Uncharacterized protein n=1 Tax=Portunus trituberculatus TaxID=210409 RepID=A0A5B7DRQ7_PORTR|nr:hypothetical protein [Portunus trituberculatus]